jgi:endonuclease YncB( thermonuclease family)
MRLALLALALVVLPAAALADPCEAPLPPAGAAFSGPVRYVGDGDSLCVDSPAGLIEVRVADFYAAELHAPGGPEAKAALSRIAMGRQVQCVAGRRSYDRVVARCTLNGLSLGDLMRRAGIKEGGNGR